MSRHPGPYRATGEIVAAGLALWGALMAGLVLFGCIGLVSPPDSFVLDHGVACWGDSTGPGDIDEDRDAS